MPSCDNCRFWSEMVAQAWGCGPMEALCLSGTGPYASKYTTARMTCAAWKVGDLGAIDSPGFDGSEYDGRED